MEVRKGYKQTELGFIPEDWEVKKLGGISNSISSGVSKTRSNDGDYIVYGSTGIIGFSNKFDYQGKAILVARVGANAGKINSVDGSYCVTDNTLIIKLDNKSDLQFINYQLEIKQLNNLVFGSGQPLITGSQLKELPIFYPPLPEQRAIATALSDVDALLNSLDALIAKKRLIKQGAMQELLTGKKRLPGFSGEWEVKRVGQVLKLRYGKSQNGVVVTDGKYPIIGTGGEVGRTNNYLYDRPSIIIGRKGTIDDPKYIDTPFWTIDTAFYSEVSDNANPKFLFYKFCTFNWYLYNEASGVPSLNATTVESVEISITPSLPEQTAIAEILSDMDAEISALEQKREKTRLLKQGMMQELLTGRIRLV